MKRIKVFYSFFSATALCAILFLTSCNKDDDVVTPPVVPPTVVPTVVGIAQSDTTFSILVAAVTKANLVGTLSNTAANFTVFAPTNTAFRNAGITAAVINGYTQGQVDTVLTPILTYHVLGAKVLSTAVPVSDTVKTVNGKNLFASRNTNGVFVNGIKVATADLNASNGVVHVIGSVLIPPVRSIAQIVILAATTSTPPEFSLLLRAVQKSGLAGVLLGSGKYTVFAPTNAAFTAAGFPTNASIDAADSATVRKIVLAHVVGTNVFAGDLSAITTPTNTANPLASISPQQTLTFSGTGNTSLKITSSTAAVSNIITSTSATFNIVATNGVIHVIDKVLL